MLFRSGYCYSKSHLLTALLRANGIPAGLCYQRLTISDEGENGGYCLHGLTAVFLPEHGWYRADPRGIKDGVQEARFDPPHEVLAFPLKHPGEFDLPGIWTKPLPLVVETLARYETYESVANNLPDMDQTEASQLVCE